MTYRSFDEWFDEIEITGTRAERFFDDLEGASTVRIVEWLKTAWRLGYDAGRCEQGESSKSEP